MRHLTPILLLILTAFAAYGQSRTYTKHIGDFTSITVSNNVSVTIKHLPDSTGYAVFTCTPEVVHILTFSNKKGNLKIEAYSDSLDIDLCPDLTIYADTIERVNNWGDRDVKILSCRWGREFKAKVIGNGFIQAHNINVDKVNASVEAGAGRIFLTGEAHTANYTLASTGVIEAAGLRADNVHCKSFGTGTIDCFAVDQLSVKGASSGHVYYHGNPRINKKLSVGIDVSPIE